MYLVFTRMPGESYRRRLMSLFLYLCYVFRALINSLVCWLCKARWTSFCFIPPPHPHPHYFDYNWTCTTCDDQKLSIKEVLKFVTAELSRYEMEDTKARRCWVTVTVATVLFSHWRQHRTWCGYVTSPMALTPAPDSRLPMTEQSRVCVYL